MSGLFVLGTGLLAEEFHALASSAGRAVEAFVENLDRSKAGTTICGRPVLWVDDLPDQAPCVCALSTTTRRRYVEQVAGRADFVTFVHPSSTVLPGTRLGSGTIVSAGVLVGGYSHIGEHVYLNRGVLVGHHARIGDYVTLQPGVNMAGAGEIKEGTFVGMGAIVMDRLTIGRGVTIAAGSLVRHDIPDHCLAAGSPAVVKRRDVEPR